jgi:hypothetical protein
MSLVFRRHILHQHPGLHHCALVAYDADVLPTLPSTSITTGATTQFPNVLWRRHSSVIVIYIDNKGASTSPPQSSTQPMASRHLHRHRRHKEWQLTSLVIYIADRFWRLLRINNTREEHHASSIIYTADGILASSSTSTHQERSLTSSIIITADGIPA